MGRIDRQGQKAERAEVIEPQVTLTVHGEQWSWDQWCYQRITEKRDLTAGAVDGIRPEGLLENVDLPGGFPDGGTGCGARCMWVDDALVPGPCHGVLPGGGSGGGPRLPAVAD